MSKLARQALVLNTVWRTMDCGVGVEGGISFVAELAMLVESGKRYWRSNRCRFPVYNYEYEHEFG